VRRQLDALAAENRQLRSELALCRRLLDQLAAAAAARNDAAAGGGTLQPGWSLSSVCTSAASDHDESWVDDDGAEAGRHDEQADTAAAAAWLDAATDCPQHHPRTTPLNLCRRPVDNSS